MTRIREARAEPVLLHAILAAAAAAMLVLSASGARRTLENLPPPPVRGAPLDAAPPATRDRAQGPVVEGDGTEVSPYVVPMHLLAFDEYDPAPLRLDPTPLGPSDFPPPIPDLHGARVSMRGFVLSSSRDDRGRARAILSRFPPGCCFGAAPVLDEWVEVTLRAGEDVPDASLRAEVTAVGILDVGERVGDSGRVLSIYRLLEARIDRGD